MGDYKTRQRPRPTSYRWHFEIVPIGKIMGNVANVDCKQLKKDIQKNGLKQNLILRIADNGMYGIVDGVHRIKALRELGWKEIPAMVFDRY
jgi:ParB-like chromosome segregation protein Spo0J